MGTETVPKTEEAAECASPLELQIIRQIEYYFGNYNLSRDKYLREELQKDDGWIPLENMVKFNRLKKLSEDFKVIADALKKSPKQLMEVDEDCTKIRRRDTTIPDDYRKRMSELDEKTLYVKGFKKDSTLDELLEFFKDYQVEHIYMHRVDKLKSKSFKGSVFVTFEAKEDAEKFLTKEIKCNGMELLKEFKKDYLKRKDEQFKAIKESRQNKREKKAAAGLNIEESKEENKEDDDDDDNPNMVRGCLLRLTNLDKDCNRELIKAAFEPLGTLVYIDYHFGNSSGVIRFDTAVASAVLEKLNEEDEEKKIEIGTSKAVVTAIEGDEETEYWKFISKSRSKSRQYLAERRKLGGGNRGFGNRGRFKKWGKRKGSGDDAENKAEEENKEKTSEPPAKKLKAAEQSVAEAKTES